MEISFYSVMLLLLMVSSSVTCNSIYNLTTDQSSLLAFKSQITSDPNNILTNNWTSQIFVCSWIGVTCGRQHNRVIALSIPNMDLEGIIPPEIGNLSFLVSLNMSRNYLYGNLPMELARLHRLRVVDFYRNNITGEIPKSWFGSLLKLEYLDIGSNSLQGMIPPEIGNFSKLEVLVLEFNELIGPVPPTIFNISTLEKVNLDGNRLTGSLPDNICNSYNPYRLKLLHLSENMLQGQIPISWCQCSQLEFLDLALNKVNGSIPDDIGNMTALQILNLYRNNLTGVIPQQIGQLRNLKRVGIAENKIVGAAMGIIITLVVFVLMNYRKKNQSTNNVSLLLSSQRHRRISYYELQQATDGYNNNNLLGTGGFGSVYKGVLQDGTLLAVKVFNMEVRGSLQGFDAECEVLRNLRHRNLTKVICSCSNDDFKALVLDYMPNGTLDNWLYLDNYFLDIVQRLNIMLDVAFALEYLHHGYSTTVIHCDLKPSNILLNEDMVAHVSDFGMAKLLSKEDSATHTRSLASLGYMAPEYGMEGIVSPKCDVYSYGIMLMEVFTTTKPTDEIFAGELNMKTWVQNSLPNEVVQVVDSNLLDPNDKQQLKKKLTCLTSIMELAISCTAQSPRDRISIKDVLLTLGKLKSKFLQSH